MDTQNPFSQHPRVKRLPFVVLALVAPLGACDDHASVPAHNLDPRGIDNVNGLGGPSHFHSGYRPGCGNGVIDRLEECDNGPANSNEDDSYGSCTLDCTINVGCGDHEIQLGYELCDEGPMGDEDCTNKCVYDGIHVFLTEQSYTSDQLGGLLGADQRCQTAAESAGLPNHLLYKAWLSTKMNEDDMVETAYGRLQHHDERYVRLDGVPVAMNWNDLVDGALLAPISVTNAVSTIPDVYVWTNTAITGLLNDPSIDCGGWNVGFSGRVGYSGSKQGAWTTSGQTHSCAVPHHLYCFEQLPGEN